MEETKRFKWTVEGTNLLVSIWSNEQVQSQLRATFRTQPIWDSIARYMTKKGFPVTGLRCRIRIKNMASRYQEAVQTGNLFLIDPYLEIFEKVISDKKKAQELKVNSTTRTEQLDTQEDNSDVENGSYCEIEVLEDEIEEDSKSTVDTNYVNDEVQPSTVGNTSAMSEGLITKAIETQARAMEKIVADAMKRVERLIKDETEKLMVALSEETERRSELEVRLDRLLSRVEATTFPQLTYMGSVVSDRDYSMGK